MMKPEEYLKVIWKYIANEVLMRFDLAFKIIKKSMFEKVCQLADFPFGNCEYANGNDTFNHIMRKQKQKQLLVTRAAF